MSVKLELTFDDLAGVSGSLTRLQGTFEDLTPMLHDIGVQLEASTTERFRSNVGPDGVAWQPSIRAKTKGGLTLVDRTHLRDSITHHVERDAVEIGSNMKKAAILQVGGEISAKGEALRFRLATGAFVMAKKVKIPARPYLGISAQDTQDIYSIIAESVGDALTIRT